MSECGRPTHHTIIHSPVCSRKHVLMMEFLHGQRLDKALKVRQLVGGCVAAVP